jgi:hypothetical protein
MARSLYPEAPLHLQRHDGRAEALLVAHWAQRLVMNELDLVGGGKAA